MADLFKVISNLFERVLSEEVLPLPAKLHGLDNAVRKLGTVSIDWTGQGIDGWLNSFKELIGDTAVRDTLLVRTLQIYLPRAAEALTILGVIKIAYADNELSVYSFAIDRDRLTYLLREPGPAAANMNWWLSKIEKINDIKLTQVYLSMLLFAPQELVNLEYNRQGFAALPSPGVPGASLQELLDLVNSPLAIGLPTTLPLTLEKFKQEANQAGTLGSLSVVGADAPGFDPVQPLNGLGIELLLKSAKEAITKTVDLGSGWGLSFGTADTGFKKYHILMKENSIDPAQLSEGEFEVLLSKQPPPGKTALLLGPESGSHLELKSVGLALTFHSEPPVYGIRFHMQRAAFVLTTDYLKRIGGGAGLPDSLRLESDLSISYMQGEGLKIDGSTNGALQLRFVVPLNFQIDAGALKVTISHVQVSIELLPKDGTFYLRVQLKHGAQAQLGPVNIQMDGAGISFGRLESGKSYLPEPPNGIGLLVDAGPVNGGGFLTRTSDGEFGGAMQLHVMGIGVSAFGLYKPLPSGGASFVGLLGIRFPFPGIQLSWGFALNGVGGLIGVNRRADTDMLRDRLSSGAAGNVLFCEDPMKQAPSLLNDLRLFFPEQIGVFVVGPTFQISWLEMLRLDLGVFIELPGPRKVFIAGSARMTIGASEKLALVNLRLDFIGGIDAVKQLVFFRAGLVHSHIMNILDITGDAALMLGYGPGGYFLFSVGGFHPSFNPGPLDVPRLTRAGASMSTSIVADAWLKLGMYLAVTPGTLQLGARVEAGLKIGPIKAHGWFEFDALIKYHPFYFEARIAAGFNVEIKGVSLCGVTVEGTMSGPGPVVIHAKASVKVLFVKVSGNVTLRLGSEKGDTVVPIGSVVEHLRPELSKQQNLRAEGDDHSVILRPRPDTTSVLRIAPVGALIWEQKRVPLGLDFERLEGVDLGGVHCLHIECPLSSVDQKDWFGAGTYLKLSDAEALNQARFSREQSGLRVGADQPARGFTVSYVVKIDLWKLPKRIQLIDPTLLIGKDYLSEGLLSMQRERSRFVPAKANSPMVATRDEQWMAIDAQGNTAFAAGSQAQAFMKARAAGGMAISAVDIKVDLKEVI